MHSEIVPIGINICFFRGNVSVFYFFMTLSCKIFQITDILGFHNFEVFASIGKIGVFRTKTGFNVFADPTSFDSSMVSVRVAAGRFKGCSEWLGSFFLAQVALFPCSLQMMVCIF